MTTDTGLLWLDYLERVQACPATVAVPQQLAAECLKALSIGYTAEHQGSEYCAVCGADLGDGEDHKTDCLTLRARAALLASSTAAPAMTDADLDELNSYKGGGLPAENWWRGFLGQRFIGYHGSPAEQFYQEGAAAAKQRASQD